jgi:serine phosphatase RsbU (regulator of sigma subunit)
MHRFRPRPVSVIVASLLLMVTVVLTVLTWQANARSEQRLLDRQLAQVGTLLTNQAAVLQVELADIAQVAVNTNANPAAFARFAGAQLTQTGQSLSLWRVTDGTAEQLAVQGLAPRLPAEGSSTLAALKPSGDLVMLGVLPGDPDRLAYAVMPGEPNTDLVVYAESPLPPGRRLPATPDSPLAGLDLALYLGKTTDPGHLLESTAPLPIGGDTKTRTVPFGTATVTVVGASPTHLTGALSATLPWIVLGVGCALAAAGGAMVETISRRRGVAERLAAENAELYRQQRSIAGTLQHALLPVVPELAGVQVAARYLAGVDGLDVGGDWYDVIERRPGCVVFVVGDVSGQGLPAATTMAALRFAVRAYLAEGHSIETVLLHLRQLLDVDTDHQFATVLLGELDASAGRLRLVSAGHFPPVLLTDGRAQYVDCPVAPPVGVTAGAPPPATTIDVSGPATLLAYSDGLVERRCEVVDVGLERLRAAAADAGSRNLPNLLDDLLAALAVDSGRDDTVLLGMRWTS